ncbi:MAG TPA: hypothetical protein DEP87_04715 [Candidatus Pacebacteria bacterium]|nr:hypothetical protein [Candidatus Paceibacterota bacterium]
MMAKSWWLSSAGQLGLILILAGCLRLYRITNPIADWHAFRQADTASVTREFVKHGVDLLRPTYLDHSNIQTGKDNPQGYRLVEFPIINGGTAVILRALPELPLELTSRLASVVLSLIAIAALYGLVMDLSGKNLAFWSALTMAVLPYSIYYSRVVLPEPGLLASSLISLWAYQKYLQRPQLGWWLLSLIALALAFLLKPFVVFLAPVFIGLALQHRGWKILKSFDLLILAGLAIWPFIAWRKWIMTFPTGIPASDWLLNGNGIRFRPAWFRWLFWERITKLILGGTGAIFGVMNLFHLPNWRTHQRWSQDWLIYAAWWLGMLIYLSVIATGNVQHDYYQVFLLPIICITLARGLLWASNQLHQFWPNWPIWLGVSLGLLISVLGSWHWVGGYFNVNHWEYVEAGQVVNQLTPVEAQVIAPAFGDTIFLFQTNRTGWPIGFEIDKKISLGADYYITTSYDDEARELEQKFETVVKTEKYLLLNLTQPIATASAKNMLTP